MRAALAHPAGVTVVALTVTVGATALARPVDRAAFALLALVVAGYSAWRLGYAARTVPHGTVVGRVRQERHVLSRAWLELADGRWLPVYFTPDLLALEPGASAAQCLPSGRARGTRPVGRLVDAPRYSPAARAERARTVGTVRRRLTVDGAVALAGLAPAVVWWVAAGTSPLLTAPIGMVGGYWWAAIRGSDPT